MVDVGDKAPDFILPDIDLKKQSLKDYVGKKKIVLAFFPLAFSPVCTNEMCSFRDSEQQLNSLDAQVIGISVDSPFTLKAFAEQHGFKFPSLSDFNREVSKRYGVLHEEILGLRGVSKRSVFIIDKDGVVRYKWVSEDPTKQPDYSAVKEALSKLS
jgi:peroxiredoxin